MVKKPTNKRLPQKGQSPSFSDKLKVWDDKLERALLLTCYTFIVSSIIVEVVRRFGLSFSSVWGEEMARYMFIYLVWLGAAFAVKRRLHIRIDLLHNFLSVRKKIATNIFSEIMTIGFCTFMFYLSIETFMVAVKFGVVTDGLRIPKAFFMFSTVLGFALILLRSIQRIISDIDDFKNGKEAEKTTLFSG